MSTQSPQTSSRRPPRNTGFGFDAIMARPDLGQFRRWYGRTTLLGSPRG